MVEGDINEERIEVGGREKKSNNGVESGEGKGGEERSKLLGNVAWETKNFLRARRPIMVMSIYKRG